MGSPDPRTGEDAEPATTSHGDDGSRSQSSSQFSVATPIGKARRVPIDFFVNNVLPPLPLDLNLDMLIDKGTFSKGLTMEGKLWGYGGKTPSRIHSKDVFHAFSSLQRGIHTIVKSLGDLEPTLIFFNRVSVGNNPRKRRRMHLNEVRSEDSLPDAFFVPVSTTRENAKWTNVAVPGEYQRDDSPESVEENVKKISQSMLNCMWKDPRRRFIYGFTAEDASMRLWYCDRSQIVVSDPFDFIVDYRTLIHFVVSISFAERHQLGWDLTMTAIDKDGERQFEITVRTAEEEATIYHTLQVLYDNGARHVLGRGTRVWKAARIVDGVITGEPVAIKDVWVDGHREREGDIYSQIFSSVSLATDHSELQRYIVAVETHGDVFVASRQDRTKTFFSPFGPSVGGERQSTQTSAKSIDKRSPGATSSFRYQVHYRVVYGEIGESLVDVTSLHTVFRVLTDVVHGVSALHQAGWVHRDLSAGNILVVHGMGKITDLEYATSEARPKKTGKTGTPFFVAVEVDSQKYLFRPIARILNVEELTPSPEKFESMLAFAIDGVPDTLPAIERIREETDDRFYEFRYNPLHDLESIWWNAVYFTVNRKFEGTRGQAGHGSSSSGPTAIQREFAEGLFYQFEVRRAVFQHEGYFADRLTCLHPSLVTVASVLENLRITLRAAYRKAEGSIDLIDSQVANYLYRRICAFFDNAMQSLHKDDSIIRRFTD